MEANKAFYVAEANAKKMANRYFEVILEEIEYASKRGDYCLRKDLESPNVVKPLIDLLNEKGYLVISVYETSIFVIWDMGVYRTAYYQYKKYLEDNTQSIGIATVNPTIVSVSNDKIFEEKVLK